MYRFGFIIEQALGHITHGKNLQTAVPLDPEVSAEWGLISWDVDGWLDHLPLYKNNWTVRSGLRARRALASIYRRGSLDAVLFHTQVPATLSQDWLERIPAVISLDATPLQYDRLGAFYGHHTGPRWFEDWKWRLARDTFRKARHLITWSSWAKQGLIDEYGIAPEKVTVIPPGVDINLWQRPTPLPLDNEVVRVLFVGGNMERKGGLQLLEAFHQLRREQLPIELHLVTRDEVPAAEGLVVYHNQHPNSPGLIELYHKSDIFVLPTYGDCLPMVLSEAAAANMPMISTRVAGIPEVVCDGETGFLVNPGDVGTLTDRLRLLVTQPHLRARMGAAALHLARQKLNAQQNAFQLLDAMKWVTDEARSHAAAPNRSTGSIQAVRTEPSPRRDGALGDGVLHDGERI